MAVRRIAGKYTLAGRNIDRKIAHGLASISAAETARLLLHPRVQRVVLPTVVDAGLVARPVGVPVRDGCTVQKEKEV